MSLQGLPPELTERIIVLLPLPDICSLRLTNRNLASNTTQKHFKTSFRTKRVQITEQQLSSFVAVTANGGLGCLLQDLTLIAPVYNTSGLTSRIKNKIASFAKLDTNRQYCGSTVRSLSKQEARRARLDLADLQERLAAQLDMIHHRRDVGLLSQALSNLVAHGNSLQMLRVEVEIYKDDATTPLLPLFGGSWKPIWASAANASHTLFASLAACDLRINGMDLFSSTRMFRCSLSCNELNHVDFASVRPGGSLGHLSELSLRVSDQNVNRSLDEEILRELTQVSDFEGVRSLLRACPNIRKLDLTNFFLRYVNDTESTCQRILRTLAESPLPRLQDLTLQGFRTTGEELLALLQGFRTIRSLALHYINLTDGSFQPILDYCTMNANMEAVDLDSLYETDMLQFEPPWVLQPSVPGSLRAGYPDSRASYRRASADAASHQINYEVRHGRTLDAGYIRAWRQDLKNRFGPLTEEGKPSYLQPHVPPEATWRWR
jgi:hypothetical protein